DIKKQQKMKREKLRKLQKKYGQITFERYSQALKKLADPSSFKKQDDISCEKNIVELYLKQNPTATEKQLELPEEELSDEELADLEGIQAPRGEATSVPANASISSP